MIFIRHMKIRRDGMAKRRDEKMREENFGLHQLADVLRGGSPEYGDALIARHKTFQ